MLADIGAHFVGCHCFAVLENDAGHDLLAELLVRNADNLNVLDLFVGINELLNLLGIDVFAAADYHVLEPARDSVVALGRFAGEVTGVQPAVLVNGGGGCFGHFVVALHNVIAARHKFACFADRHLFPGFRVNNFTFNFRHGASDR